MAFRIGSSFAKLLYKTNSINTLRIDVHKYKEFGIVVCPQRFFHLTNNNFINLVDKRSISTESQRTDGQNSSNLSDISPPITPKQARDILSDVQKSQMKLSNESKISVNDIKTTTPQDPSKNEEGTEKKSLVQKVKAELIHYYHGFRLLFVETKVAFSILTKVMRGYNLSRRERKQLVRTVADLFRMVPFIVFVVVPFAEFLLPVYLKFFPFMLPSTFKEESKEAEKRMQLLKAKLEMAKFLQDTLEESRSINKFKLDSGVSLETFNQFMKQVRDAGHTASTDDILKFSRLFEDEVTMESLDLKQLKALCQLLELNPIGPKALLNFKLRMRVRQLKADDMMIAKEGIDKLPSFELQQLCRERGMRAVGVSEDRLRFQLSQWLKLSIDNQIPISLLLISRTMYLPNTLSTEEQLTKAILHLPMSASKEASLRTTMTDDKFDHKTRLEIVQEEQKAIKDELMEAAVEKELLVDKAKVVVETTASFFAEGSSVQDSVKVDESISAADLAQIETAIESLETTKTAIQEEELEDLKEQAAERDDTVFLDASDKSSRIETKLDKKLDQMINEMDYLLEKLKYEKDKLLLNVEKGEKIGEDEQRVIAITDVMASLKKLKAVSNNEAKWQRILDILDEDKDGKIEVHHISEVMEMLGNDSGMKLTSTEMTRVLDAIDKEEAASK